MKRADLYIAAAVLLIALTGMAAFHLHGNDSGKRYAEIFVAGELYRRIPLDATDHEVLVASDTDRQNLIRVGPGGVYVAKACCRNQICVNAGTHTRTGSLIACLPNRVVVSIVGCSKTNNEEAVVDAVSY